MLAKISKALDGISYLPRMVIKLGVNCALVLLFISIFCLETAPASLRLLSIYKSMFTTSVTIFAEVVILGLIFEIVILKRGD